MTKSDDIAANAIARAIIAASTLHLDGEPLTIDAANLAGHPCERRCTVCEGSDEPHHWVEDCADEGDLIQVCKHCPAWRPWQVDPDDPIEGPVSL